jgi:predicted ATPase
LKVIGAVVTALVQGRGGVLVIEGPPGIGKSRLLSEVMALADKYGVRTLFGEAFEYQQTVLFFALFMATLRADPPGRRRRAAPAGRLGGPALLGGARSGQRDSCGGDGHPAGDCARGHPLADNGTLLALRSLTTARRDVPVLWVLTVRTGAGGPAVQETLSVLQCADATFVLVAAILGATMKQRLDQLSDGAGEVVREAAVLPDRFSAGLLAAMLERQPASLMSAIEEAVRADLLVEDEDSARG